MLLILLGILLVVSLYDLFSPPITRTMWRQTQTAMLTENFVKEGFSVKGLYINLGDQQRLMTVYEFPLYNFMAGLFFLVFGSGVFWGKFISLIAAIISLAWFYKLVKRIWGEQLAMISGLFFVFSPVGMLIRTSFQPDALSLMFMLGALNALWSWKEKSQIKYFAYFCFSLMLAGLVKATTIVPYLPLIGCAMLYDQKKVKMPGLRELLLLMFLVAFPIAAWFLLRGQITDLSQMADDSKLFIGDLNRFFAAAYYIKPALTILGFLWCGVGALYFLLGLNRLKSMDILLLLGIPFYFIIVPTVSDQYYYLYAILPIIALFMSRGFLSLYEYCVTRKLQLFVYVSLAFFAFGFIAASGFVLMHDRVMLSAAESFKRVSAPSDLVLAIYMHDRGTAIGSNNTSLFYLADRKGWAIWGDYNDFKEISIQVSSKQKQGAKWLVITWYTPELEPWFANFTPKNLRRDPGVDGKGLYAYLKDNYPVVRVGRNYAVMRLK